MDKAKQFFSSLFHHRRCFYVSLGVMLSSYVILYFLLLPFFAIPVSSLRETLQESLGEGALESNFIAQFGGNDFTAYSRYLFEALKDPVSLFAFYPALKRSLASSYPSHNPSLDNRIDNTKYTLYLGSVLGGIFLLLVLFLLLFFLIRHLEKDEIFESSQDFSKAFKTAFLFNFLLIGMLLLLIFLRSWVSILLAVILYLLLPFFSLLVSYQGYGKGRLRLRQALSFKNFLSLLFANFVIEGSIALISYLCYLGTTSIIYAFLTGLLLLVYPLSFLYVYSDILIRKAILQNLTDTLERTGRKKNTYLVKNKTTKQKLSFLKNHLGFKKEELNEIKKMYDGEFFSPEEKGVKKLYALSEELCERYNTIYERLYSEKGFVLLKDQIRLISLTRKLFCGTYMLADVRSSLSLVIGLVDAPWLTFFNHGVTFTPYSSVSFGSSVDVAPQVTFGDKEPERKGDLIRISHINVEDDCWIGIHAEIKGEVTLGRGSVLGAGARVESDLVPYSLALGRPARSYREIPYNGKEKKKKEPRIFTKEEQKVLYHGLRKVSYLSRRNYHQVLKGKFFNVVSLTRMALYNKTHHLCSALEDPSLSKEQREELLSLLFPGHGKNLKVGKHLFVDMVGTVWIGDNVTIGDDVCLGGNVRIGNNVTIGNRVGLFSSGHPLSPKERNMRFSLFHGFYQVSRHESIQIQDDSVLHDDVVVGPNSIVKGTLPSDSLYIRNKVLQEKGISEEEKNKTLLTQALS